MLIEFKFGNFLSFKDPCMLTMVGVKSFKEMEGTNTIEKQQLKLLKTAVIYGNNGSGKSNMVKAVKYMKYFTINSFRDALLDNNDKKLSLTKFLLNSQSDEEPASFETSFFIGSTKYRYGFEVEEDVIKSEWLFHTTSKEIPLFTREGDKFYINQSSFKEGISLEKKTKDNVLFLTLVAQFNGEISEKVVDWFKNVNIISGVQDKLYKKYTISRFKHDRKFRGWVNQFIEFLEISKLTTEENPLEFNSEFIMPAVQLKQKNQLVTWHKKYDKNNFLIDTVPFNFDNQESEGTKKLLHLLGPWYDTIKNGKILIVDELDSRLHSKLIRHLIRWFHSTNNTKAQLIFAVHDTSILSKEIFRRDQIWFIDKNQFGASELYSLSDFKSAKVRNSSDFAKNYLNGKYGAIPYFKESNELKNMLYGKE